MANQPNPAPGGAGNQAPAANPPAQNQPAAGTTQQAAVSTTAANQTTTTRRPRGGARTAPTGRLTYTRCATAGNSPDRINSQALVTFWKVMTVLGGVAIVWIIVSTSHCVGRQGMVSPISVTPSSPTSVSFSPPLAVPVPVAVLPPIVVPPARVEITNKIEVAPENFSSVPPTAPKSCDQYFGAERLSCERWAKIK